MVSKFKTGASTLLILLCFLLIGTGTASAAGDDTDGSELQVAQPVILEVQLGGQWAGVEFQLKTDAGLYPGTIHVGEDGVLRMELGNSGNYILSCLNSATAAPSPSSSPDAGTESQPSDTPDAASDSDDARPEYNRAAVGGIPIVHLVFFGGGMLLAVGILIAMHVIRNRKSAEQEPDGSDDEEDEY